MDKSKLSALLIWILAIGIITGSIKIFGIFQVSVAIIGFLLFFVVFMWNSANKNKKE